MNNLATSTQVLNALLDISLDEKSIDNYMNIKLNCVSCLFLNDFIYLFDREEKRELK